MSNMPHKFFELQSQNNLNDLKQYLDTKYNEMKEANWTDKTRFYDPGNHWLKYNIFHFYHEGIYNLQNSIKDLTIDACNYYNIDFKDQNYYIHGWFNYWPEEFNTDVDPDNLKYHDHGDHNPSLLHGYYCVSAEPSMTHYKIDGKRVDNVNKNNKIIVSKNGYYHTPGAWKENYPRITIAYNIVPLKCLSEDVKNSGQFVKL